MLHRDKWPKYSRHGRVKKQKEKNKDIKTFRARACASVWANVRVFTQIHTCEWILVPKATQEQSVGKMSKLWMQGGTNGACGAVKVNVACRLY